MLTNTAVKLEHVLRIDESAWTPKFLQIVNEIIFHIETGTFKPGDRLPSINETSTECYLARATVEKAYGSLLKSGHLTSLYRKGFFVAERRGVKRVLFLTGKINQSNRAIFNAVSERLGKAYKVDIYTYEYRRDYLCEVLEKQAGSYQHVLLMPHCLGDSEALKTSLQKIPNERLLFLDESGSAYPTAHSSIRFGCGEQFQQLLEQHAGLFKKYPRLHLVTTEREYIHADWYRAVLNFSARHGLDCRILDALDEVPIQPGNAYLLFDDADLVTAIKGINQRRLKLGTDVGLVSFNDDGYKELVAGGISVLSTDIPAIAQRTADLITQGPGLKHQIHVPMQFIRRASL